MWKRRPFESWSLTKSADHRALGRPSTRIHDRDSIALAAPAFAHHQTLLAIKALSFLAVQGVALGAKQDMQPTVAEPPLLTRCHVVRNRENGAVLRFRCWKL